MQKRKNTVSGSAFAHNQNQFNPFTQFAHQHGLGGTPPPPPPPPQPPPPVLLPRDRHFPEFAAEVASIVGPLNELFRFNDEIVRITYEKPLGQLDRFGLASGGFKIEVMTPVRLTPYLESCMFLCANKSNKIVAANPTKAEMETLLETGEFRRSLPVLKRVATAQAPYRNFQHEQPEMLLPGWNEKFGVWCTQIGTKGVLSLETAKATLDQILAGFPFKVYKGETAESNQARTHMIASLITTYVRGIIGYNQPVPCWWHEANRGGSGKDYLMGVKQIVFEGYAFEDAALAKDDPADTRKRITAGLRAGRRHFHFANCSGNIDDPALIQAITNSVWRDRALGSNNASSDLCIPNEAEYSISVNKGADVNTEDFKRRIRKICLEYYEEEENSRTFPDAELHATVEQIRNTALDALDTFYREWIEKGMTPGKTPFSACPRWGRIVGGIMTACGLGDPCLPNHDDGTAIADPKTKAVRAVYELLYDDFQIGNDSYRKGDWIPKAVVYQLVADYQDEDERLLWFGVFSETDKRANNAARTKLGSALSAFNGRVLGGIKMEIDTSDSNSQRWLIRFLKV